MAGFRSRRPLPLTDVPHHKRPGGKPLIEQRYEFGEWLGRGSSGVVRGARLREGAQEAPALAIKTYNNMEFEFIVHREFEILKRLRGHPNIMQCVDLIVDQDHGRIDLVLRQVHSCSLHTLVERKGRMLEAQARLVEVGLLRAIQFCHERRVAHRDVKPANLMVEDNLNPNVTLIDFNTAVVLGNVHQTDELAGGLTPTGTRAFMAPETVNLASMGEMVDLWGAGLILYFMLTSKIPWIHGAQELLLNEKPMPTLPKSSEGAAELLEGLLQKSQMSRWMAKAALTHPWCQLSRDDADTLSRGRQVGAIFRGRLDIGRGYHTPEPVDLVSPKAPGLHGCRSLERRYHSPDPVLNPGLVF